MAKGFNLTAEINLRGPSNVRQVVDKIRKQLTGLSANVDLKFDNKIAAQVSSANKTFQTFNQTLRQTQSVAKATASSFGQLKQATQALNSSAKNVSASMKTISSASQSSTANIKKTAAATQVMTTEFQEFGKQSALAVRRFAAFATVTGVIYKVSNAITSATQDFVDFEKELVKVAQVSNLSISGLQGLVNNITRLSTGFGVASKDLIEVSRTLTQAGLSASDTSRALEALAKSALAPTFDDLNRTVEGSVALMRQFGISAGQLESALGSINAVAGKFAVEAGDIITAISRTGGVFASASKGVSEGTAALNEFIAVFTSVRATTRESAETIATGLRTIFTRIQRGDTIDALKEYGVQLQDLEGKFVGPYEATRRLAEGLSRLDPRDIRFSRIVEELGGFRQIGKVIPLIQQFTTAQQALAVAQQGQGSLARDAATAQLSLANQITKVREEFTALIRSIAQSSGFRDFVTLALDLTSGLLRLADAAKGALPALTAIFAIKGIKALGQFGTGFLGGLKRGGGQTLNSGGYVHHFARGGKVPGSGSRDTVPAMLQPGEFVIRKKAVEKLGTQRLHNMNKFAVGGPAKALKTKPGISKAFQRAVPETQEEPYQTGQLINADDYIGANVKYEKITQRKIENDIKSGKVASNTIKLLISESNKEKGNAFEEYLVNSKRTTLQRTNELSANYPVDFASKGGYYAEAKNVQQKLPNELFLDKLYRARVKDGSYGNATEKPSSKGGQNINLGNIKVFTIGPLKEIEDPNESIEETKKAKATTKKAKIATQNANLGGYIQSFAKGGDVVPAMLTPGEFVINKKAASRIGSQRLNKLNKADRIQGFNKGGAVGSIQRFALGGGVDDVLSGGGLSAKDAAMLRQAAQKNIQAFEELARITKGWPVEDVAAAYKSLTRSINNGSKDIDKDIESIGQGLRAVKGSVGAEREPSRQERIQARNIGLGDNQGASEKRTAESIVKERVATGGLSRSGNDMALLARESDKAAQQLKAQFQPAAAGQALTQFKATLIKTGSTTQAMQAAIRTGINAQTQMNAGVRTFGINVRSASKLFPTLGPAIKGFSQSLQRAQAGLRSLNEGRLGKFVDKFSTALAFVGPALADQVGNAIGGSTGAGIAGAATGFTTAVAVGGQFGPFGALVGAAAGVALAIDGYTTAVARKESELAGIELDKTVESSVKTRESFIKTGSDADAGKLVANFQKIQQLEEKRTQANIQAEQPGMLATAAGYATFGFLGLGRDDRSAQEIAGTRTAEQQAGGENAQALIASMIEAGKTYQQTTEILRRQGSTISDLSTAMAEADPEFRQQVAEIQKSNKAEGLKTLQINKLRDQFAANKQKQIEAQYAEAERLKASKALTRVILATAASMNRTFDNLEQSISAASNSLKNASDQVNNIISGKTGFTANLDALNVLQNPNAFSRDEQNQALRQGSQFAGQDRAFVEQMGRFSLDVNDIIGSVSASSLQAGDTPEVTAGKVVDAVAAQLQSQFGKTDLTKQIIDDLREQISKGGDVDIQKLLENRIPEYNIGKRSIEASVKALKFLQDSLNFAANAANEYGKLQSRIRDNQASYQNTIIQSDLQLKQALGKKITVEERIGGRTRTAATRAGVNPAQFNAQALSSRRDTLKQQVDNLKQSLQTSANAFDSSVPGAARQFSALTKKLAETENALKATEAGLESLPKVIEGNISDIIGEIGRIQQEMQGRQQSAASLGEKLVGSTPQELADLSNTYNLLNNTLNGQITTIQQSQAAQQAYSQTLQKGGTQQEAMAAAQQAFANQTKSALSLFNELSQMSGLQGPEIMKMRADLLENFAKGQGTGLDQNPMFRKILELMRTDTGESPEIKALTTALEQQQKQLGQTFTKLNEGILAKQRDVLTTANQAFIKELNNVRLKFDDAQLKQVGLGISRPGSTTGARRLEKGGVVYASQGKYVDFQPKGTDTVPAMLTPGEFVVNAKATKNNLGLLRSINSSAGSGKTFSRGGVVYAAGGLDFTNVAMPGQTQVTWRGQSIGYESNAFLDSVDKKVLDFLQRFGNQGSNRYDITGGGSFTGSVDDVPGLSKWMQRVRNFGSSLRDLPATVLRNTFGRVGTGLRNIGNMPINMGSLESLVEAFSYRGGQTLDSLYRLGNNISNSRIGSAIGGGLSRFTEALKFLGPVIGLGGSVYKDWNKDIGIVQRIANLATSASTGTAFTMGDAGQSSLLGRTIGAEQGGTLDRQLGNWSQFGLTTAQYAGMGLDPVSASIVAAGAMNVQEAVLLAQDNAQAVAAADKTRRMEGGTEGFSPTEKSWIRQVGRLNAQIARLENRSSSLSDTQKNKLEQLRAQRDEYESNREKVFSQRTGQTASSFGRVFGYEDETLRLRTDDEINAAISEQESNANQAYAAKRAEYEEKRAAERQRQNKIAQDKFNKQKTRERDLRAQGLEPTEGQTYQDLYAMTDADYQKWTQDQNQARQAEAQSLGLDPAGKYTRKELDRERRTQAQQYNLASDATPDDIMKQRGRYNDDVEAQKVIADPYLPPNHPDYDDNYQKSIEKRRSLVGELQSIQNERFASPFKLSPQEEARARAQFEEDKRKRMNAKIEEIDTNNQQILGTEQLARQIPKEERDEAWADYRGQQDKERFEAQQAEEKKQKEADRRAKRAQNEQIRAKAEQMATVARFAQVNVPDKFSNPSQFFTWRKNMARQLQRSFPFGQRTPEAMKALGIDPAAVDAIYQPFSADEAASVYSAMINSGKLSGSQRNLVAALRAKSANLDKDVEQNPAIKQIIANASDTDKKFIYQQFQKTFGKQVGQVNRFNRIVANLGNLTGARAGMARANIIRNAARQGVIDPNASDEENIDRLNAMRGSKLAQFLYPNKQTGNKAIRISSKPKSTGGVVYASTGMLVPYEPRGTDTVPAMLTPGEFVVNRAATQKHRPLLESINRSKGGPVKYLAEGGSTDVTKIVAGQPITRENETDKNVKNLLTNNKNYVKQYSRDNSSNQKTLGNIQQSSNIAAAGIQDISGRASDAAVFSRGGPVPLYAQKGMMVNYQPKGTDTVPAMLTPGEFVVNAKASKENLGLLQAINSGYMSDGGVVYAQDGMQIPMRKFTDASGQHSVMARIERIDGNKIILRKDTGKRTVPISISQLSKEDQTYVNDYIARKTQEYQSYGGHIPPGAYGENATFVNPPKFDYSRRPAAGINQWREYTDSTGKYKANGKLLRVNWKPDGKAQSIVIKKEDGTQGTVSLDRLSWIDQVYINGLKSQEKRIKQGFYRDSQTRSARKRMAGRSSNYSYYPSSGASTAYRRSEARYYQSRQEPSPESRYVRDSRSVRASLYPLGTSEERYSRRSSGYYNNGGIVYAQKGKKIPDTLINEAEDIMNTSGALDRLTLKEILAPRKGKKTDRDKIEALRKERKINELRKEQFNYSDDERAIDNLHEWLQEIMGGNNRQIMVPQPPGRPLGWGNPPATIRRRDASNTLPNQIQQFYKDNIAPKDDTKGIRAYSDAMDEVEKQRERAGILGKEDPRFLNDFLRKYGPPPYKKYNRGGIVYAQNGTSQGRIDYQALAQRDRIHPKIAYAAHRYYGDKYLRFPLRDLMMAERQMMMFGQQLGAAPMNPMAMMQQAMMAQQLQMQQNIQNQQSQNQQRQGNLTLAGYQASFGNQRYRGSKVDITNPTAVRKANIDLVNKLMEYATDDEGKQRLLNMASQNFGVRSISMGGARNTARNIPNADTTSNLQFGNRNTSLGLYQHEVGHALQTRGGWDASVVKDPAVQKFLTDKDGYVKLWNSSGMMRQGVGYSPAALMSNPAEIFTNMIQFMDIAKALGNQKNESAQRSKQLFDDAFKVIMKSMNYQNGGVVYANQGMLVPYQPKGTDTVPAMLTPGEFVVNREATKHNLGLLRAINRSGGGRVSYLANGTDPGMGFDFIKPFRELSSVLPNIVSGFRDLLSNLQTPNGVAGGVNNNIGDLSGLSEFTSAFRSFTGELSALASQFPFQINLQLAPASVNVNITGGEVFNTLQPALSQMITMQVSSQLNAWVAENFDGSVDNIA